MATMPQIDSTSVTDKYYFLWLSALTVLGLVGFVRFTNMQEVQYKQINALAREVGYTFHTQDDINISTTHNGQQPARWEDLAALLRYLKLYVGTAPAVPSERVIMTGDGNVDRPGEPKIYVTGTCGSGQPTPCTK